MAQVTVGSLHEEASRGGAEATAPSTQHSFEVRYLTPSGEQLEGVFTVQLPSAEDYRRIATALSNLLRGANWASLPMDVQQVLLAMARCSVLVREAPDWFRERSLEELGPELFLAVSEEAARFEREFFRALTGAGGGGQERMVVEVRQLSGPAVGPGGA